MFSKKLLVRSSCLVLATVLIAGCIGKMGEDPPPVATQKFSGAQCLSTAKPVVSAFFDGTAEDRQVAATWDCVSSALDSFKRYVRGRTSDRYTPQEVATFLEDNFLEMKEGEKVSEGLQVELMKIKQLLVGGSVEYITLDELTIARNVIQELRAASVAINPYMKIVTQNWKPEEAHSFKDSLKFFEEANVELQNTAKTLAEVIERNGRTYQLSDFVSFMDQMAVFIGKDWTVNQTISKYMPVVRKVKKAIAGGNENAVEPKEWRRFALLGARGYVQYLRYHYFIATAPESGNANRLAYLARTVEDIFSVFADLVGEKPEGVVSRDEVADLLSTLSTVWPEFHSSPTLVLELMKLKQVLFGGSVDNWTSADFTLARSKVDRLKMLVEKFLPYSAIYAVDWIPEDMDPVQAREFFAESQIALQVLAKDASGLLENSYSLSDLESLMAELSALYPGQTGSDMAGVVSKYLPLIVDAKNIFIGGTDATISKAQWPSFLGYTARIYTDYLFSYYFLKEQTWNTPATLQDLSFFVNQSLDILRDILLAKESNQISRAELLVLMNDLAKLDILPKALTAEALSKLVNIAVNNVLLPFDQRLAGKKSDAFTLSSIEVAREEAQVWLDAEKYFVDIMVTMKPGEGVTGKDFVTLMKGLKDDANASPALKVAALEFIQTIDSPVTMSVDTENRLLISSERFQVYDGNSLRKANLNRAVARLLIRSLAKDAKRIKTYSGINQPELEGAFVDLMPLIIEMGLIDPANKTFAASRFREANIFTPHGDGTTLASLAEISDIVGMIFSGLKLNNMLSEPLYKDCFRGATTVPSTSVVKIDCVKKSYKKAMPQILSSMPGYVKYMARASDSEWSAFMTNVLKAAGYVPNSRDEAKLRDISLAPHVIQYIEMIFLRFDKDRNGIIDTAESLQAFPSFRGIMMELAAENLADGSLEEKDLDSLFTYILRNGKPPESLWEKWRFASSWRGKPENWDVAAGRSMLAKILGYIADQVNKNARMAKLSDTPSKAPPAPKVDPDIEMQYRN